MRLKVQVAVSDPALRARLTALLRRDPEFIVVGPAEAADLVISNGAGAAAPLAGTTFEGDAASPLTPRELEVLGLLALGMGNKGIARELGISRHTAKFHVAAVLGKLGAHSRAEAVALGMRRGLVPL